MEIITLTIIGIISRLVPHLPNMTPVGATALFSSAKFGMKKGLIILLLTMLISDVLIGLHPVMWATYGSFMITILIGWWVQKKYSLSRFMTGTLVSSIIFFIITNFAVWLVPHGMYAKTLTGLIHCYIMALPFFRNSLIGDFFYGFMFYYGYEVVRYLSVQKFIAVGNNK
jgi:hypothetical protein